MPVGFGAARACVCLFHQDVNNYNVKMANPNVSEVAAEKSRFTTSDTRRTKTKNEHQNEANMCFGRNYGN